MESLLEKLEVYAQSEYYPMHMPGHKRNTEIMKPFNPVAIDITEIDGFDNLHHAEGILRELQERVQRLYHSQNSYLLINGSTVGLLAGIRACVNPGDQVIVARNCHKAVYHAILLNELEPVYIYPPEDGIYGINGGILPEKIEELLITHPLVKLVILTSPTYEGIVSNIQEIVEISHKYGVPVLVDEAHGAHLGFSKEFPTNSIAAGADVVIHSIHKTLPAFTQTALAHVNGDLVEPKKMEQALAMYETSSPSYVLMASMDQCMNLLENRSKELFEAYVKRLTWFEEQCKKLKYLQVMSTKDYADEAQGIYALDPSKLLISVKNTYMTGKELYDILLHEYKIQLEMSSRTYALAMTSICDTNEGFRRLADALIAIDGQIANRMQESSKKPTVDVAEATQKQVREQEESVRVQASVDNDSKQMNCGNLQAKMYCKPSQAMRMKSQEVGLSVAVGRVSMAYVCAYPPGIPIVVPGELIECWQVEELKRAKACGLEILGLTNEDRNIHVIQEEVHQPIKMNQAMETHQMVKMHQTITKG